MLGYVVTFFIGALVGFGLAALMVAAADQDGDRK